MESCEYMSSLHGAKKNPTTQKETCLNRGEKTQKTFGTRPVWRVDPREIELEVELPRRRAGRIVAILVHEREAELDDLQQVDVAPQQLVLVVHCAAELADWPDDDAGEFCVLAEDMICFNYAKEANTHFGLSLNRLVHLPWQHNCSFEWSAGFSSFPPPRCSPRLHR